MFESICIRLKNEPGNQSLEKMIDFGLLAEAMLFYQNVHLIAGRGFLELVVKEFRPEILLGYLEAGFLKISYIENFTGIYTENTGTRFEKYRPELFSIPDYNWKKHSPKLFSEAIGCSMKGGRRYSIQVSRYIKPLSMEDSVKSETLEDFSNYEFVRDSVTALLKYYVPEYKIPEPFVFNISRNNTHWFVETNIDFEEANKYYHKHVSPKHSSLSTAYLLSNLMEVRSDWYFSSHFSSEIIANSKSKIILSLKFNDLLKNRQKSEEQINVFQDFVFNDGRALREAINSGERNFRNLFELLSEANKFKLWLKDKQPDKQLIKEYFQEVTKKSWIDKLPPKSIRWALFNAIGLGIDALGAGGIGKILGLTVSAGDQFLLDKILKGWKPNQFVDTTLKDFVTLEKNNQSKT
jgi:hypothetical protein